MPTDREAGINKAPDNKLILIVQRGVGDLKGEKAAVLVRLVQIVDCLPGIKVDPFFLHSGTAPQHVQRILDRSIAAKRKHKCFLFFRGGICAFAAADGE